MLPHLQARGIECEATAYPSRRSGLRELVRRAALFDLVWLQKKLPGFLDYLVWRRLGVPLVFDFDDAICYRAFPKRGSYYWPRRARRFRRITRLAAGVTCGNGYLSSLLPSGYGAPVLIYPSPVPIDVPRRDYVAASGPLRLGWIGDGGNLGTLARVAPELAALSEKHRFVLRVISDRPFFAPGVNVENVPWSLTGQSSALAELDFGLMPLIADSPFDRGKCAYKVLQYMAAGVVPVAEAVGMNCEVIDHRRNGLLVPQGGSWESALDTALCLRREALGRMGTAALERAAAFSYERFAEDLTAFLRFLQSASSRGKARSALL
jgi:hypothetical protein